MEDHTTLRAPLGAFLGALLVEGEHGEGEESGQDPGKPDQQARPRPCATDTLSQVITNTYLSVFYANKARIGQWPSGVALDSGPPV